MKRLFIMALVVLALAAAADAPAQLRWKPADVELAGPSLNNQAETPGIAIYSIGQSIVVKTNRRVEVRVFTILGQVVSQGEVPAGTHILDINSRGIYIVKIDNITQKVAL